MHLRTRVWLYVVATACLLAVILAALAYYFLYQFILDQGREQGRQAVALSQVAITEAMLNGQGHKVELGRMLERLQKIPGFIELRLLRGEAVVKQFGPGGKEDAPIEDVEKEMLATGRITETIDRSSGRALFHYNGPLVASRYYVGINCMQCHHVSEGEILGGMSVQLDLSAMENEAIRSLEIAGAIIVLLGILVAYLISRLLTPVLNTASDLSDAVANAEQGRFDRRLKKQRSDEIGGIADSFNRLMDSLSVHLGKIVSDVESLTGSQEKSKSNVMEHSAKIVHSLVEGARFKEAMSGDRDLEELYARVKAQLMGEFGLNRFALYNVNASKNRLETVFVEGLPDELSSWCDPAMQTDAENCRAKRSGKDVDSVLDPFSCTAQFCVGCNAQHKALQHLCMPVMGGEGVSAVLQIVFEEDMRSDIERKTQPLHYYLSVAASEIESKKLLANLKATSLRDPLTGLHNRRYLEDLQMNLAAAIRRRESSLGILMCDIDLFKQVNDTYGHDVGDLILKEISSLLIERLRASDHVIRFGGEEIVVLLEGGGENEIIEKAEGLRQAVQNKVFRSAGETISKTISIGVAVFPTDGETFDECLKLADLALYQAKNSGRNKVIRYQDQGSESGNA